jgi:hypothetical protein
MQQETVKLFRGRRVRAPVTLEQRGQPRYFRLNTRFEAAITLLATRPYFSISSATVPDLAWVIISTISHRICFAMF